MTTHFSQILNKEKMFGFFYYRKEKLMGQWHTAALVQIFNIAEDRWELGVTIWCKTASTQA